MHSVLTVSLIAVIVPARPNGARLAFCPSLFLLEFGCLYRRQSQWEAFWVWLSSSYWLIVVVLGIRLAVVSSNSEGK
jgi:hypothetical protein